MELIALAVAVIAICKALERWATPLVVRYRARGILDASGVGFEPGHGHVGGDGGC